MSKPQPPSWLSVTDQQLRLIDPGRRIRPFSAREVENGIFLRGPLVFAATASTDEATKKDLPILCHDAHVEKLPTGKWVLYFFTSPQVFRTIKIEPRIEFALDDNSSLLVHTTNHGIVRLRKIKLGDKPLYLSGPDNTATDVEAFVESVWASWLP